MAGRGAEGRGSGGRDVGASPAWWPVAARGLGAALLGVLLALGATPTGVAAQDPGVITGTVRSSETARPLAGAQVAVRAVADSAIAGGALANNAGAFRVAGIPAGRYFLEVQYVGHATERTDPFDVVAGAVVAMGAVDLAVSALALDEIAVRTQRAPASFRADRTIYETADMPVASGGTATEVLRSVPELEVDIDGAVTLRGSTPQVYINGRPAPMEGEALNVFLEQFPADRIERVEVIPNPGARFDAEGAGGIVNIVLKKDVELGLSGSVFANAGSRGEVGGGGRLAWQRGDWTLSGGGYLRHSDRESSSYDLRQNLAADPTTFLQQDAWSSRSGLSSSLDLGLERAFGERALAWAESRIHRYGNDSKGLTTTAHLDAGRDTTQRYDRVSASDSERLSADLATGFRYAWQPQRHLLEAELEVEIGRDDELERVETLFEVVPEGEAWTPAELTLDDAGEEERELTAEVDYVRPWGEEGRLEVGYRGEIDDRDDSRLLTLVEDPDGEYVAETLPSGFSYRQVFNSVYATALQRFGAFGIQAGVRAERALSTFELPDGDAYDNAYTSLFPSANVSLDLDDGRQLRLSYSRRVRRPSPWVMNPIDRSSDPLNRRVGNPYIEPQYTHSVSMDASWTASFGTLRLSPYWRKTENDWAEIKTVDADGVSTVTWENVASQEQMGASLTASVRPIGGWSGFASVSGQREDRDASNLAESYSGSSFRWSARTSVSARLTESLSAQGMFSYSPARDLPQGRISSRMMTHFGVRQQLLDDRASIRVSIVDPFDLFSSTFETRDPTHVQIGRSDFSMRSVRVSVSWAFGSERDRRDPTEEPEEPMEDGIR